MTKSPAGPTQRLMRSLLALVAISVLGLVAGIVLVSIQNAQTNHRLSVLEEYVQGRGEYRDQETQRLEEQMRTSICDLLDQLPEGGLLDRPRSKYDCGPGIPLSQLTPQEQAQLQGRAAPSVPPSSLKPLPPAATPNPPRPAPGTLPPRTGPGPTNAPTATPTPLAPITGTVCDVTGVCLGG